MAGHPYPAHPHDHQAAQNRGEIFSPKAGFQDLAGAVSGPVFHPGFGWEHRQSQLPNILQFINFCIQSEQNELF